MEIILIEKVVNLGQLGDVVSVKDGYARNYLIPHGKARRATAANLEEFKQKRAELENIQAEKLAQAQARAEKLEGYLLQITRKAGMDGKLFGSVSNGDVVDALNAQGFDVTKPEVRMSAGHLKAIGDYPVVIMLHTDVDAHITVSVLGEN
ncbi:MAG TPA: 50S ribosomal protein L9 [Betaproteobacteria bacterium]|nr:50S ribosomal protein L9 [Betaproteobacteria bacterium]